MKNVTKVITMVEKLLPETVKSDRYIKNLSNIL